MTTLEKENHHPKVPSRERILQPEHHPSYRRQGKPYQGGSANDNTPLHIIKESPLSRTFKQRSATRRTGTIRSQLLMQPQFDASITESVAARHDETAFGLWAVIEDVVADAAFCLDFWE